MHRVGMAKLSQQLMQTRPTRTQRVIAKREYELEKERKRKKFEELKKEAEQTQKEKFTGLSSIEDYEKEYQLLRPEIQQFFSTPETLRKEKAQRIETNKEKLRCSTT